MLNTQYNQHARELDTSQAIEIAPRVWWVGSMLPNDDFQCHVYLIEQGDQSVLIDPGSALIASETIRKIDSIIGLEQIRWLVCSHADPDIIGALPAMVARGLSPDAQIVTYWRDEALIVHSGTPLPFWRIEDHDWRLSLEDRDLRFVFTPYLHFAGAFCTFDESTETLFSSDLFGGFTDDKSLFAKSVDYFEAIRPFHEHYMPSREIMLHTLEQLKAFPIQRIAPQHGQVIPAELVRPIMEKLEKLECGIYLLARDDPGLAFLLAANETLHGVVDALVTSTHFSSVCEYLSKLAQELLNATSFEIWAGAGAMLLQFDKSDEFSGHRANAPEDVSRLLGGAIVAPTERLLLPIVSPTSERLVGVAVVGFNEITAISGPTLALLNQISGLVQVGLEREILLRSADLEKATWRSQAMHDPLTGLLNRASMPDAFTKILENDGLSGPPQIAALMVDIDFFKNVNDQFGHQVGDNVLKSVAHSIRTSLRPNDLVFRYGGEEFLVMLDQVNDDSAYAAAERIRAKVASSLGDLPPVSVSVGVAMHREAEKYSELVARADAALYQAKRSGRDQTARAD